MAPILAISGFHLPQPPEFPGGEGGESLGGK